MRKILISVFVSLLLIFTVFFVVNGNELLNVKGVIGLNDENKSVEAKIGELNQAINVTYKNAYSNLEVTVDTLMDNKAEYETEAILADLNDPNYTSEMYSLDFIWTRLGNFAKDEGVDMSINAYTTSVEHLYDLKFSVNGTYLGVTNFIYDIENDSKLGFKIDDFSMTKAEEGKVSATYVCEKIYINISNTSNTSSPTSSTSDTNSSSTDTSTSNTTTSNTTTSNTTTNTTNFESSTNTANTTNTTTNTTNSDVDVDDAFNSMMGN